MVDDSTSRSDVLYFDTDGNQLGHDDLVDLAGTAVGILEDGPWSDVDAYVRKETGSRAPTGYMMPQGTATFQDRREYSGLSLDGAYLVRARAEFIAEPRGVGDALGVRSQTSVINRERGEGLDYAADRHHREAMGAAEQAVEELSVDLCYDWR